MSDLLTRLRNKESIFVAKDCKDAADELELCYDEISRLKRLIFKVADVADQAMTHSVSRKKPS